MAVPVPVPKDSLFKLAVDLTKASVKQKGYSKPAAAVAKGVYTIGYDVEPKAEPQGVPLIKKAAKPVPPPVPPVGVPTAVVPVTIPLDLAQSILSKPTTGGGWQAIMGNLQQAIVQLDDFPAEGYRVLNLTPALLQKIIDKATAHGTTGGYQGILKTIVCLAVKQHPGQILSGKGEQ